MLWKASRTLATMVLILTPVMLTITARAQFSDRVVLNIPFEFSVGDRRLPAGRYQIKRTSQDSRAFTIQSTDYRHTQIVLAAGSLKGSGKQQDVAKLVFNSYGGGMYFLSQVWLHGDASGEQIPMSRTERSLRREVASEGTQPKQVELLARS